MITAAPESATVTCSVPLGDLLRESTLKAKSEGMDLPLLSLTRHEGLVLQSDRFKNRVASDDVSNYKVVKPDQLVYSPIKVWEGAIGVLQRDHAGLVSPLYLVWDIVGADPGYMNYLLRSPSLIQLYRQYAEGTGQRRQALRRPDFTAIEVMLPSLYEQKRIAAHFATVERSRSAASLAVSVRRQVRDRVFDEVFAELQTSRDKALGDVVVQRQYGTSVRGSDSGAIALLRMSNISGGEVQFQNLQYVDMGTTDVDKYLVRPGDILFNRTNSPDLVGKTGIVREGIPAVFASYLVRLVCDESQVLPDFLNLYLNWEMTQMELRGMATRGVSQANISASVLATLPVPVPERAVQQRTIDLVGAAMRALRTAMGVEVAMEHVYRSVLSLTFDGEGS